MNLKYQQLIDQQGLSFQCPPPNCKENEAVEAARWVTFPIDHELNFLPNHVYNTKRDAPQRPMDDKLKCGYCSLSFHTSVEASEMVFHSLNPSIQKKLGYTHVAKGNIGARLGLMSELNPITKHFEFFETINIEWSNNFIISTQL